MGHCQVMQNTSNWNPQRAKEKRKGGDRKTYLEKQWQKLDSLLFFVLLLVTPLPLSFSPHPYPKACWPPYSVHWCPHLPTTSAHWPLASRTLEACVFQGWDSLLLRVLTWSSWASPALAFRSHVRSQNPLQIRLVQWEVYTHRYTQEKEQKPITSSHIRALIPVLSDTCQIFSLRSE